MNIKALTHGKTSLIIGLILVLIISVGYRSYKIANREAFHIDEISSVTLANYADHGWVGTFKDDSQIFTGKELQRILYSDNNSLSEILKDIWRLHKDTRDGSHSNFYYSLLRLSFWGADTGEFNQILLRAGLLNMLLFLISFLFVFKLIRLGTENNLVILSVLLVAFMSPGAVYSTFSFRPYQLQETMFSILTYFSFICFLKIYTQNYKIAIPWLVGYSLLMALSMLTGYFGIPYVLMMWGVLVLGAMIKKQIHNCLMLGGVMIGCILYVYLIYPNFFVTLFFGQGQSTLVETTFTSWHEVFGELIKPIALQLNIYFFGVEKLIILFVLMVAGLLYHKFKERKKIDLNIRLMIFLMLICFIWIAVVVYFAPWKGAHYYRAIFPILTIAIFIPIYYPRIKLYYLLLVVAPLFMFLQLNIHEMDEWKLKKGDTPVVFCGDTDPVTQECIYDFFKDDRLVGFSYDKENLEQKLDELDQETIVAIVLAKDYKIYTEEEFLNMPLFHEYIDTSKYEVIDQKLHYSFHTLFYVKPRIDN